MPNYDLIFLLDLKHLHVNSNALRENICCTLHVQCTNHVRPVGICVKGSNCAKLGFI